MKKDLPTIRIGHLISAALFIGIFALLAIRSWDAVLLPILGHEDGRDMFAFYFNNSSPCYILRYYAGYVSVLTNAIGWAAMRLPLPTSPYVFTLASLVIATLGFYLLSRHEHAWLIPDACTRIIIVVTLAILPLGRGYLVNNLTYSQWSLFFLLIVLLSRWPLPSSIGGLSAYAVAVALCAASHPLSILTVPLCVAQFVLNRHRSQRLFIAFCACAIVAYQAIGVQHSINVTPSLHSVLWAMKVFLARVSFESVFGARATTLLTAHGSADYVYAFGIMILCMIASMVLTGKRQKRDAYIAGAMLLLAFAVVMISTMVRYVGSDNKWIHLNDPYLQRYIYIPKIIFTIMVLWQIVPRIQGALRSRNAISRLAFLAACCVYVIAIIASNRFLYRESQTEGYRVREFIYSVFTDSRRAKRGEPYQSRHVLDRGGSWDIVLMLHDGIGNSKAFNKGIEIDARQRDGQSSHSFPLPDKTERSP